MHDEKKKLDEKAILERLSNGAMVNVNGGTSPSFTDQETQSALTDCLAGCGCGSQRACTTCQAVV